MRVRIHLRRILECRHVREQRIGHGAALLDKPLASGDLMRWGQSGPGQWVTVYANGGHAYMVVAGLRFDTSGRSSNGTRWQADMRSPSGYVIRHPPGL